ncbi:MAG: transposase family protein, partial [Sulfitobacter sp.]|nr:transposase family protein [Sulfitobacter sp.]
LYRRGCNHADVARSVDLRRTTLAEWRQRYQLGKLSARPLGRPVQRLSTETLRRIHDQLVVHGPGTGLSTLQVLFPDVPRRELKVQRDRFRKKWLDEHKQLVESLRWTRPGAVWAMDFTEPDRPIEGPFKHVLLVRDLGSKRNLLWLPLERATGRAVFGALRGLIARHGAPLVIKVDNAKAFDVPELQGFIESMNVLYLKSPPYAPWYNGSVESGIGTLKAYTHHAAARADHPEYWTCDDLEAGLRRANHYGRPEGLDGPSSDETWMARAAITNTERIRFRRQVLERWADIVTKAQNDQGGPLNKHDLARATRDAIQWALTEEGILQIRRRRISPAIKRAKASNI